MKPQKVTKFYTNNITWISYILILAFVIIIYLGPIIKSLTMINGSIESKGYTTEIFQTLVLLTLGFIIYYCDHIYKSLRKKPFRINKNDSEFIKNSINEINNKKGSEAKFIEYCADSIKTLFEPLILNNFKSVKILVQHPEYAVNPAQKKKICMLIGFNKNTYLKNFTNDNSETKQNTNFEIKCYKHTASIRGRLIGNSLTIGSYHYEIKNQNNNKSSDKEFTQDIKGHNHTTITYNIKSDEGKIVCKEFNKLFDRYWEDKKDVVTAEEVCENCDERNDCDIVNS